MIETDRLILRQFNKDDLDMFWDFAQEENIGPLRGYTPDVAYDMAKDYCLYGPLNKLRFAIYVKELNRVIGIIELMDLNRNRFRDIFIEACSKEIGYCISKNYRGKGYMSEALRAVIHYAFTTLNLNALYACNNINNVVSEHLQEKSGFSMIGTFEDKGKNFIIEHIITKKQYLKNMVLTRKIS